jgi:hypothetical protein
VWANFLVLLHFVQVLTDKRGLFVRTAPFLPKQWNSCPGGAKRMYAADEGSSADRAETRRSQTRTILQAVMWTLRRVRVAGGPRQLASAWPNVVRSAVEAYGYNGEVLRHGSPSPQEISDTGNRLATRAPGFDVT